MTALNFPFYGVATVSAVAGLPTNCPDGTMVLVLSSYSIYIYNITANTWSEFSPAGLYAAGNTSTAKTLDWNNGTKQSVTATGNVTFTLSNPVAGISYRIEITQDGTGSRTYTWPAAVKWPGGTAPTGSGAAKIDMILLFWDGTSYIGTSSLNH
jgi:hypothetical protein